MIPLLPLLTSKWGIRIGAGVLVLVALFAWGQMKKREGKEEGKQEQQQESATELHALREQDRLQTEKQVEQLQAMIESYKAAYERSTAREGALAAAVSTLASQRQSVVESVNRMPDSAIHGYIVQQLNLRPQGDTTAGYLPAEERELARCVADRPLCQEQVKKQEAQIAELREGQRAQQQQIDAQGQKYSVLEAGYNRLQGYYTTLANLYPRKKRSGKCIWLWKCGEQKLPTPEPLTLVSPQGG